ncbi:MAG: hypothetical protein K2W85_04470 [Phycisphaerales bacterium]|nr:hypothetical protein [Phycisphaerales bacterium]
MPPPPSPFVSRGGLKLRHALDVFGLDPTGLRCADFGANVGGFTDCLLQGGAAQVTAIDTGYGTLAWTLRNHPRVRVMERTSALHAPAPAEPGERMDLIVIDMGWTPQKLCIPAALTWLKPEAAHARIITLIKPHYELTPHEQREHLHRGVLDEAFAATITERVCQVMPELGVRVLGVTQSPVVGGAGKKNATGNAEWLAILARS